MGNIVLLVVDTQKGITDDRLYSFEEFMNNVSLLITEARTNGIEVIFVRHDDGPGTGFSFGDEAFEIYEGFAPLEGERIFDKNVNSAFNRTSGLLRYLRAKNVERLITVGLQTDYCMDATIKSGFEHGFEMIVPAYCNSTTSNDYMTAEQTYRFYNESMWPGRYAACIPVDEAVKLIRESKEEISEAESIDLCGAQDIETDRLLIRAFRSEDAESMMRNWISDEYVQGMYGEPAYKTKDEVDRLLGTFIRNYQSGCHFRWGVFEKESGECIGQIAYFLVDTDNNFGEIEYCIGKAYQGRGYATEACKAVIDYGFDKIGFNKVQICVRPANTASNKVIDKCGFTYEGTLRDYFLIDGKYEGRKYYSILRNER